ncbi:ABC transporter permease [Paenibacillus cymbidii]|uniref:ABC transporter permease n=1 Tax=Paenibacillus cymbidii TaxID=1639034 RepID=UPI001F34630C|nr:ABC transporter permease subunit [Paenibacillus cymbidii]
MQADSRFWKRYTKNKYLLLLLLPVLVWYVVFAYIPMYGIIISFKDFKPLLGITGSPWIGLRNFELLWDPYSGFVPAVKNTLIISFYHIVFGFPAPIVLALLFNELRAKLFMKVAQTISYLPHFFSWVVMAGLLSAVLSPSSGAVNEVLSWFGIDPIYFLGDKHWFRFTLVVSSIWKEIGWGTIIYLAALAGIDPDLYEAAVLDGASRWKMMLHITLPSLLPVVSIMFILRIGGIMDGGFDQIFNLYNPAVYAVADIIDTFVYRTGLTSFQYSFATTVGLFKNVIAFLLILLTNYAVKKAGQEGLV